MRNILTAMSAELLELQAAAGILMVHGTALPQADDTINWEVLMGTDNQILILTSNTTGNSDTSSSCHPVKFQTLHLPSNHNVKPDIKLVLWTHQGQRHIEQLQS